MYLGLDLGTGSVKAAVVDRAGVLRWVGEQPYDLAVSGERVELDPGVWWSKCRAALEDAPNELLEHVQAVSVSGQMHGLVVLGRGNAVLRKAILWPDRRAVAEADVFAEIERAEPGSLANPAGPGMPGPMLLWLRRHEPSVYAEIEQIVAPKDHLRSKLTGEAPLVTDPSDASATLMFDARNSTWSRAVGDVLGLTTSQMPAIEASTAVTGHLTEDAARELGLRTGIPVAAGAGDSAAALVGLGIDRSDCVMLNVGTAAQVISLVDEVRADFTAIGLHQFRTAASTSPWYVLAPVLNSGLALMWVRTMLGMDWDELFVHAEDALGAAHADPVFVPYLVGERDPDVGLDARGAWLGLSAAHDRAALARSALVGVACYLAHRSKQLLGLTAATRVVLSGGSTRNPAWAQLITTLVGHDVHVAVDGHASVRGAARLAARSQGDEIAAPTPAGRLSPQPTLAETGRSCIARLLDARS